MGTELPLQFAVILGTNEIASAVAIRLHRRGCAVVLSHDPMPPVLRRKMAFHDALFDEVVTLDGVEARRADSGLAIRARLLQPEGVTITDLGLLDLIVLQSIDTLVDARLQQALATPDLRRLARLAIGLGPGFHGGVNCDRAIAIPRSRQAQRLGGHGDERFRRAEFAGRWRTALEIGTRIYKDFVVGHLGPHPVAAPFDGVLRGVVRDGIEVPAGVRLFEIDPRGRQANWTEIDHPTRRIADTVIQAISLDAAATPAKTRVPLHLVR